MARILSEHVLPVSGEKTPPEGITLRGDGRPPDDGRPPAEYVHPGMRLAVWVWLGGFLALSLQLVAEASIVLVRAILHHG
jgi:hypothetical protein